MTRVAFAALLLLPAYGVLAYVVLPASWRQYGRLRPWPDTEIVTHTAEGIPGDPLNVALVGTRDQIVAAMRSANCRLADRISMRSSVRDAASLLFDRPYLSAPVSTHFLWDRAQDLAFERIVGASPRCRHHVRFWKAGPLASDVGRLWLGAATFDRRVGLSRYTGELMHHIDPDVDAEREKLVADLAAAGRLARVDRMDVRPPGQGRNGTGDLYVTDGRMCAGTLRTPDGTY